MPMASRPSYFYSPKIPFASKLYLTLPFMSIFYFFDKNEKYSYNSEDGISISHQLDNSGDTPKAWYSPNPSINALQQDGFTGDTRLGGSVNSSEIRLQPHNHGTHTECYGHLTDTRVALCDVFNGYLGLATLHSVDLPYGEPIEEKHLPKTSQEALILRTSVEGFSAKDFSNSEPSYISPKAMEAIVAKGVNHLLIDLPSIDPEFDQGKLIAHRIYWGYQNKKYSRKSSTITEMVRIPKKIADGRYLLNLQTVNWKTDAVPSNPIIYPII